MSIQKILAVAAATCLVIATVPPTPAADEGEEAPRVSIQVNGIVCSFCAHGVKKALGELPGLDRSVYGDGVLVDIESQRVTLALVPTAELDFADVHRRVLKGGYEPVEYQFHLEGRWTRIEDRWVIEATRTGRRYAVTSDSKLPAAMKDGLQVRGTARLSAEEAADSQAGQTLSVTFDEGV